VEPGTYNLDAGEIFLNFFLNPKLRAFAGVHLAKFLAENGEAWLRWCRIAMGFHPSPYIAVQMMVWLGGVIKGNPQALDNAFHWDVVHLNLPGSTDYDPAVPCALKLHLLDERISGDFMLYIDNLRPMGPSEVECHQPQHKFTDTCNHYGVKYAYRKQCPPSLRLGTWYWSVIHTDDNDMGVMATQERWDNTKRILEQIWSECQKLMVVNGTLHVEVEGGASGLNHEQVEREWGFLIYVTHTYPSMVLYIKGIHLTLDNLRPGRNTQGWKRARGEG
jgi:hypothetical protein